MGAWFETVNDLWEGKETLRRRPYGVIEVVEGRLLRIRLRPFPKITSLPEAMLLGRGVHAYRRGDRCWLFYNQPSHFRNFLVLEYVLSTRDARFGTFHRAVEVLDEIARIKRSDALLCDVSNRRISTRLLARWGWEPHCPSLLHRHYIKRFYGQYPPPSPAEAEEVAVEIQGDS